MVLTDRDEGTAEGEAEVTFEETTGRPTNRITNKDTPPTITLIAISEAEEGAVAEAKAEGASKDLGPDLNIRITTQGLNLCITDSRLN